MSTRGWVAMAMAVAVAVGLFSTAEVLADDTVTAEIRGSQGDAHQIAIPDTTSDAPFSFDVFLTTSFDTGNVEFKVQSLDGAYVFELTVLTFDEDAGWGYFPLTFNAPDDLAGAPDDKSSQLIGCLSQDTSNPAGTSRVATIDAVVKAGTAPGSYRLNLVSIGTGDTSFVDHEGTPGDDLTVVVAGSGGGGGGGGDDGIDDGDDDSIDNGDHGGDNSDDGDDGAYDDGDGNDGGDSGYDDSDGGGNGDSDGNGDGDSDGDDEPPDDPDVDQFVAVCAPGVVEAMLVSFIGLWALQNRKRR